MTATPPSDISVSAARSMARLVVTHHLGSKPKRVIMQTGGMTNYVFMVNHADGDLVVRLSPDPVKLNAFIKEQWAIAKAKELDVPTPDVLEVGNEVVPYPYMISRKSKGKEASFQPQRLEILHELGRYAALVNSIGTSGFGSTFDWSNNQLSRNDNWDEFLDRELMLDQRLEILRKRRILAKPQIQRLASALRRLGKTSRKPSLNHGDLRLKNVLVDDRGAISAIIDWENCISSLAPHWELSLALHDLSIDEKHALLDGYGLKPAKMTEMIAALRALNIINYAPEIERLVEEKDTSRLEHYRVRLNGALDLYCI